MTGLLPGLDVSRETLDALRRFEVLTRQWNPRINLVGKRDVDDLWSRHIIDSAQLFLHSPQCDTPATQVDLGSGGGFPGIVLALIDREMRPAVTHRLIESDQRKAAFLRTAVRHLELSAEVLSARAEDMDPLQATVLTARALSPLDTLLPLVARHLAPNGIALLPKGRQAASEIEKARRDWMFDLVLRPSITDPEATILLVSQIQRAPRA